MKTRTAIAEFVRGELLDGEQAADLIGVSSPSLRMARSRRTGRWASFPEPLRLVSGRGLWLRADVEQWLTDTEGDES